MNLNEQQKERFRWAFEVGSYAALIVGTVISAWIGYYQLATPAKPVEKKVIVKEMIIESAAPLPPQGWSQEAVDAMRDWTDHQAKFRVISKATGIVSARDNTKANVRLWKLTALNVANPPPNGPQLTGDCASWSSAHAIENTQSAAVSFSDPGAWGRAFPAWLYGAGRVWIWKNQIVGGLPSEGCSVGACARAAIEFGVLSWDEARAAGYEYSGQLADRWGWQGPPEKLKAIAAKHKLVSASPMSDANDVRDAICNGYGVATGGDFTPYNFHAQDGRIVADNQAPQLDWRERWHHAMAIDGYDGTGSQPYFHLQNSWYPASHPAPIDDSPACGMWITAESVNYMCKKGRDTWAMSGFEGFTERTQSPVAHDLFSLPSPANDPAPINLDEARAPSKTRISP